MHILQQIVEQNVRIKRDSDAAVKNRLLLSQHLSKPERKLLLKIVDDRDLLIEEMAYKNYENGFREGVQFATEIFTRRR